MPSNHQNSVGWINLQLAADDLKRKQLEDQQIRADRREQEQTGVNNALQVANYELKSKDLAEKNKLTLAGLMTRKADDNSTKIAVQQMKDAALEALRAAQTKNQGAQAVEHGVKAVDIPLDTKEVERSHKANEFNVAEGQKSSLMGQMLKVDPGYGYADTSAAQAAHSRLGLPPLAVDDFSDIQRMSKKDLTKTALDANNQGAGADRLEALYKRASEELPDSYFGLKGSAAGANTLKDWIGKGQSLIGMTGTDLQKGTAERADFNSGMGLEMAQTVRDFSGAQSAEPEAARLGATTGIAPADFDLIGKGKLDPFSMDRPVFLKVLRAAINWKRSKEENDQQILRNKGIRIKPAGGQQPVVKEKGPDIPNLNIPNNPDEYMDWIMQHDSTLSEAEAYARTKKQFGIK